MLNEQYKYTDNLRARMSPRERFASHKEDFARCLFDRIIAPSGAKVLELGSGPANLSQKMPLEFQQPGISLSQIYHLGGCKRQGKLQKASQISLFLKELTLKRFPLKIIAFI